MRNGSTLTARAITRRLINIASSLIPLDGKDPIAVPRRTTAFNQD
jgi:hypothetical protein